ncbi:Single-stranded-DNA-specific exonuclease RecJ [hydrothermal vent metagenome]|uniref:Single-stranded-DNA-specific exonuclease RecJ n=1 Tax=hydrothermal vent metagenome TaxID=652676 RepID=A0A3B0TVK7_9ZZZZ
MSKYLITNTPPEEIKENLKAYSPLTQTLLFNRDITLAKEAEIFLNPDYERDTHDPFLILGMEKAVERILSAIAKEEKIVIYGDYDCDGIPGSVVLHDFFKKIGYKNFENYIPHRHEEGYGFHLHAVEAFAKNGVGLIITVDCGITDVDAVKRAKDLSMDVIITDHHLPICRDITADKSQEILPPAFSILNSKQKNDTYPDDMLCGAGVAWKLVCALLQKGKEKKMFDVNEGWEKWLLDMAGLSTLADMVPLQNENRALAYFGLKVLRKSPRPGLQKLLRKAKVAQIHLTEDDVGFMIAPRINAASRMDVPMEAFRLLATDDEVVAGQLSDHLHNINNERKLAVAVIVKDIKKTLAKRELREVIVVGNPKWRVGVLGIAANNIMEEFGRPVFVWGREGSEHIKGSCRSDGTVNLVELMTCAPEELFLNVGGHELAGGFSMNQEKIHLLEDELVLSYGKVKREQSEQHKTVDKMLDIDEVTWNTYKDIERFAPFGVGNPKPVFLFENIEIAGVKVFGKERNHLELKFQNSRGGFIPAIGFFMDENTFDTPLEVGRKIKLTASLEKSMFRGRAELRLRIIDIFV